MNRDHRTKLLRLAATASVVTATLLIFAKLIAWFFTSSVAILASLVDSLMDVAASLINLVAIRYSLMPADEDHRFGHGKAEPLAGLAQATFIGGSALFLVIHALDRLLHPVPLQDVAIGIGVMAFSIVATAVLLAIQRRTIEATGSTAIRADSLHYVTDLLTNGSIVLALLLASTGWPGFDPLFAVVIAVYIAYSAWRIGFEAFHLLMDVELPAEIRTKVLEICHNHPGVLDVHELRTRRSGQQEIIQLHLDMDADLLLRDAHRIGDEVEASIRALFPTADIIVHHDPREIINPP